MVREVMEEETTIANDLEDMGEMEEKNSMENPDNTEVLQDAAAKDSEGKGTKKWNTEDLSRQDEEEEDGVNIVTSPDKVMEEESLFPSLDGEEMTLVEQLQKSLRDSYEHQQRQQQELTRLRQIVRQIVSHYQKTLPGLFHCYINCVNVSAPTLNCISSTLLIDSRIAQRWWA